MLTVTLLSGQLLQEFKKILTASIRSAKLFSYRVINDVGCRQATCRQEGTLHLMLQTS